MMSEEPIILQNDSEQNLRIDKFLAQELEDISRSYIKKIISKGGLLIYVIPVIKKSEMIPPGTYVVVIIPPFV
jgi:23S rRNA-/tRNA-specific pseudouridylate synthase